MNPRQVEEYLEKLPGFSPKAQGKKPFSLEALERLLERLGNPHKHLKIVHVAGTNGKGSVIAFLNSILTDSGIQTGVFTSPFLCRKEEMFRIGEKEITPEMFAFCLSEVIRESEFLKRETGLFPSEFELYTAAAFLWFQREACDLVLLETGLGGASDATNVIPTPKLAVLTSISRDHVQMLGESIGEIATVKAGIIKKKGRVLSACQEEAAKAVLQERCRETGAKLYWSSQGMRIEQTEKGQLFETPEGKRYQISMQGSCQIENAMLALAAASLLQEEYPGISERTIRSGLLRTSWRARFEKVQEDPWVILDGSHNEAGVRAMADSLKRVAPGRKIRFVVGVLEDKDWQEMLSPLLEMGECFYTLTVPTNRGLDGKLLAEWIRKQGKKAQFFEHWMAAVEKGIAETKATEVFCVFGSLYYLGEVRKYFRKE